MNPKLPPVPLISPKRRQNEIGLVTIVQQKSPVAIVAPLRKDTALIPRRFIRTLVKGANA